MENNHPTDRIVFIGYRGTGKTSVGKQLSKKLGWLFFDSDQLIEEKAGKSIATIFEEDGEACFRDLESSVIQSLCKQSSAVLSLGGGAVLRAESRQVIAADGTAVVFLTAPAETLLERISSDESTESQRPALTSLPKSAEIEHLLTIRTPIYQECATLEVDTTNKTLDQIVEEISPQLNL